MIILLGGIRVNIVKIKITSLYGMYDYDITFDENLTFLYGENGCGKTTILNIVSSIITGKLYELRGYEFKEIDLVYCKRKNHSEQKKIIIIKNNISIEVCIEGERFTINDVDDFTNRNYIELNDDIEENFFKVYPLAHKIKQIFNYIYLPLNRYGFDLSNSLEYIGPRTRNRILLHRENSHNTYLNYSLNYISNIIRDFCTEINFKENRANEDFRKKILMSSVKVSSNLSFDRIFEEIENSNLEDILKSKETYVKTMNEIDSWDKITEDEFESFFKNFEIEYKKYIKNKEEISNDGLPRRFPFNLMWMYKEFMKIKEISELAKKNEERKRNIREPKEKFLRVINDNFLKLSDKSKEIQIDKSGVVRFKVKDKFISLENMSSGEKQIFIIFASLIFGLKNNRSGIYIIDEPEASLHLKWQKKFVSSIMEINPNIQLIFATHSPEIIGHYRNYMVKLTTN